MKFDHIGIPTTGRFAGDIDLPQLRMTLSDHLHNPFHIQWQRYWDNVPDPDLVQRVPHVAFEIDDLAAAIEGQCVIIEPTGRTRACSWRSSRCGAHPSGMQIDHEVRPDL